LKADKRAPTKSSAIDELEAALEESQHHLKISKRRLDDKTKLLKESEAISEQLEQDQVAAAKQISKLQGQLKETKEKLEAAEAEKDELSKGNLNKESAKTEAAEVEKLKTEAIALKKDAEDKALKVKDLEKAMAQLTKDHEEQEAKFKA